MGRSALPGTLRALIAARVDQLPASQRAIIDNAAVLGSPDSIGSLARFAQAIGQDFHPSDIDELAADGLFDVQGGGGGSAAPSSARSPTRPSPSGCGPSATPASPP